MHRKHMHMQYRALYFALVVFLFLIVLSTQLMAKPDYLALEASFCIGLMLFLAYEFFVIPYYIKKRHLELVKKSFRQVMVGTLMLVATTITITFSVLFSLSAEWSLLVLCALSIGSGVFLASRYNQMLDMQVKKWSSRSQL